MNEVKLSQPKSARTINIARVFGCLRTHRNLSKAEIARVLGLNKVSTGEIVDELIADGLVKETGKMESANGRRPTRLSMVPDAKYVLGVDIGRRNTTVALCNLLSEPVHFERIPTHSGFPHSGLPYLGVYPAGPSDSGLSGSGPSHTGLPNTGIPDSGRKKVEQFVVELLKSCTRVTRLADQSRIIGAGVSVGGKVSADGRTIVSCPYLPWRDIPIAEAFEQVLHMQCTARNSTYALVDAERYASMGTDLLKSDEPVIYIEWGDSVSMSLVCQDRVFGGSNGFAHLKVSPTGLCGCGQIGCLEANVSAWAIGGNQDVHLKELWGHVGDNVLDAMADAIRMASLITGSEKAVIGGEGATITDDCLERLGSRCPKVLLERSMLGDRANIMASAEIALDEWVYLTSMLEKMSSWL